MDLKGSKALVTGGSRGIGFAAAELLLSLGQARTLAAASMLKQKQPCHTDVILSALSFSRPVFRGRGGHLREGCGGPTFRAAKDAAQRALPYHRSGLAPQLFLVRFYLCTC